MPLQPKQCVPELLAPGGSLEKVQVALKYGADAVYVSGQGLSLRAKSQGLTWDELALALEKAHSLGKKIYFCLNILARDRHFVLLNKYIDELQNLDVDGLIIADPGVLSLVRQRLPEIPVHLSTQANTSNSESVRFWQKQGVARVNLARELSLREIRFILGSRPKAEIELFVHGAMCMAVSGRCLLSDYLTDRSANLGLCTHPCRYEYRPLSMGVEEKTRPGETLWEAVEDGEFSSLFAAQDLCLLPYLPWMARRKIHAIKIEGRMKSVSYLAQVVDVYRTALDDLKKGRFRIRHYLDELSLTATRDMNSGFFLEGVRKPVLQGSTGKDRGGVLAKVEERVDRGTWLISVRNKWHSGNAIEMILPGMKRPEVREYVLESREGEVLDTAHSGQNVILRCGHTGLEADLLLRRKREQPGPVK